MGSRDNTQAFLNTAHQLLAARVSLVAVPTWEEARIERLLVRLASSIFPDPVPLCTWSMTQGILQDGVEVPGTLDIAEALRWACEKDSPVLFVFRDAHRILGDPMVARLLRDAHRALDGSYRCLFLVGPGLTLPIELQKEAVVLELPIPGVEDLGALLDAVCADLPELEVDLGEEREALLRGAMGLTEEEARRAFRKLVAGRTRLGPEQIPNLLLEKRGIVGQEGILEFVDTRASLDQVGGLGALKRWLRQRRRMFADDAEARHLDLPRGLLVTGISGCGKSFVVKAIAGYWQLPLLRLDMNRVYAAVAGSPERTLERAIKTAEAVAPCVLWIDEIETALLGTHGQGGSQATRIFSSFLTWMQEKEAMVFVAATANEIDQLPPELLRKGRFDQVFFVDLPELDERREILQVHLVRRGLDPEAFEVEPLARASAGFSGAELEQLVMSALYAAFGQQRPVDVQDLYDALANTVPLSRTMGERIKAIKRWADTRAVKANG